LTARAPSAARPEVMSLDRTIVLIMAGGAGERLKPLTRQRSKAAVPFGGKYRLIDFTLSNCINSGLRQIYVLTQYRSGSLNKHIQEGWDISSSKLGEFIYCMPAQQKVGSDWYRGTADAVRQNLDLFRAKEVDHILVLSGDHVYKMNYGRMIAYHKAKKADLTVCAIAVDKEEAAGNLGVIEVDHDLRMIGFEEKPQQPKTIASTPECSFASMGVYVFSPAALRKTLDGPGDDFGKDLIPPIISAGLGIFVYDYATENRIEDFVYEVKDGKRLKILVDRTRDSTYWRDVGTIDSYYEASMDLVGVDPLFNLYAEKWPLRTYQRLLPPTKLLIGGITPGSLVCDGCIISGGTVRDSILSPGVVVERHAFVEECIVFDDVIIEPGASVRRAIIDKESRIQAGVSIGYDPEADRRRGCTVSPEGITVVPIWTDLAPL
jgi:glucose-1-phosphate adenylyltransferase